MRGTGGNVHPRVLAQECSQFPIVRAASDARTSSAAPRVPGPTCIHTYMYAPAASMRITHIC